MSSGAGSIWIINAYTLEYNDYVKRIGSQIISIQYSAIHYNFQILTYDNRLIVDTLNLYS